MIFDLEVRVAAANGYAMASTFGIDFNEPEYPMTVQDEVAKYTFALENNLMTPAQILQTKNKDLSIQQAQKIIDQNKEINGSEEEQPQSIFGRIRQEATGS